METTVTIPLIIFGSVAIDRIMSFSGRYRDLIDPANMDSLSLGILMDRMEISNGGVGGNLTYNLAMLGDGPILLSSIGHDGAEYVESLHQLGVDTSHIHESKLPTACFNVISDADENQIGGFYPGAMADSAGLHVTPWKDARPVVVVAPNDPAAMRRIVAETAAMRARLVYAPSQQTAVLSGEVLREGIAAAEVLILNEYEMTLLIKKTGMSQAEIEEQVPMVVVTYGKDGSVVTGTRVPEAVRVGVVVKRQAVDPTGAGDAFCAGWLHGMVRGWEPRVCAQYGATCAAYAVEAQGAQTHRYDPAAVAERYEAAFGEKLPA